MHLAKHVVYHIVTSSEHFQMFLRIVRLRINFAMLREGVSFAVSLDPLFQKHYFIKLVSECLDHAVWYVSHVLHLMRFMNGLLRVETSSTDELWTGHAVQRLTIIASQLTDVLIFRPWLRCADITDILLLWVLVITIFWAEQVFQEVKRRMFITARTNIATIRVWCIRLHNWCFRLEIRIIVFL